MDETTRRAVNAAAIVTGYGHDGDTELLPCIEIAGVAVFAYLHPDGALRVALHFDTADPEIWPTLDSAEACIPVVVDAGGPVPVWAADEFGTETTPELERLRNQIDQLTTRLSNAHAALAGTTQRTTPPRARDEISDDPHLLRTALGQGEAEIMAPRAHQDDPSGEPVCNHDEPARREFTAEQCECGAVLVDGAEFGATS